MSGLTPQKEEQLTWLVACVKNHRGPVVVLMHHPPFSSGGHRMEWQRDSVLIARRDRMVRALHEAGISIIASGHEHAYERALLTWPDAALIAIVTGGGGSPLHKIPPPAESAQHAGLLDCIDSRAGTRCRHRNCRDCSGRKRRGKPSDERASEAV